MDQIFFGQRITVGVNLEYGFGIAVGPGNVIYLGGQTFQSTRSGFGRISEYAVCGGLADAFLVKLDSMGTESGNLLWRIRNGRGNEMLLSIPMEMYFLPVMLKFEHRKLYS
ncbi:MAG: hypothetical protein IPG90_17815 [Bacteroidetes bacterium]|nr:hypothetical protein [Bacteroidota bacterium]